MMLCTLMTDKESKLSTLQERLGYQFKRHELLELSLTHPSYTQQEKTSTLNNQRLEFLGDAVLSLVLAENVYFLFPDQREGALAQARSVLAQGGVLSHLALELKLNDCVFLSPSEIHSGGQEKESVLEDAFEALIGALYLDSDLETTRRIILELYGNIEMRLETLLSSHNPKGRLQEKVQPRWGNNAIEYIVQERQEPDHQNSFKAEVLINGYKKGEGTGHSKKEAEEEAARDALVHWSENDNEPIK